jgi:hypothetical protein
LLSLLCQVGQSFKVAGEEYEAPPEERVEIVDVKVGAVFFMMHVFFNGFAVTPTPSSGPEIVV